MTTGWAARSTGRSAPCLTQWLQSAPNRVYDGRDRVCLFAPRGSGLGNANPEGSLQANVRSSTISTLSNLQMEVKTGFAEEFLFRGLIAGSLSRRLSFVWANLVQALIFLAPHLFILVVMPAMWPMLLLIFAGALFMGWVRIKSGSIVGPWLVHASVNMAMGLSVAIRTET